MSRLERVSPHANNYMRGGARVFVRRASEPASAGMIHLGNIINVTTQPQVNANEHVTGINGRREVDRRFSDVRAIVYAIATDENTTENVRLWLLGGAVSQTAQSAVDHSSGVALSACLKDVGSSIEVGRYYDLTSNGVTKVFNIDKTYIPDSNYPNEHVRLNGRVGWIEGQDFYVDYYGGKIVFYKQPSPSLVIQFRATALADIRTFSKLATAELDVVAEGWYVFEDGSVVDYWTIPSGRLEPAGGSAISVENPKTLEFNLVQILHPTEEWGTYTRFYPNY